MLYDALLLPLLWLLLSPVFAGIKNSWTCSVSTKTTFVPNIAMAEAQYGSASFIHGGLAEPWPVYTTPAGRRIRGVRYCFTNKEAKDSLKCNFWTALSLWVQAAGKPGEESGHSMAFQEANNGESDPKLRETLYCYSDITGFWDPRVPDDTLEIRVVADSSQSSATVGYKGINGGRHPHRLTLGSRASASVIAHEFGHVLGMVHEHTRNDRDQYVRFNCEAVRGYEDALGVAMSLRIPPTEAKKRLCEDPDFAKLYDFKSSEFIKNDYFGNSPNKWGTLDEPGGFDVNSIMLYSSYAFGDVEACLEWEDDCPLLEIVRDAQGNEVDTRLIPQPIRPSVGDAEWVKRHYCWPADATCKV